MDAPRRPETTAKVTRGVSRLFADHGLSVLTEVILPGFHRADVVGLCPKGRIWIVEVKSSLEDFKTDEKWADYLPYADAFFFAVDESFPQDILPTEHGLIIADEFGGAIVRAGDLPPLAAARRKALTLDLARTAMIRLSQRP